MVEIGPWLAQGVRTGKAQVFKKVAYLVEFTRTHENVDVVEVSVEGAWI